MYSVNCSPVTLDTLDDELLVNVGLLTRGALSAGSARATLGVVLQPRTVHSRLTDTASLTLRTPAQHQITWLLGVWFCEFPKCQG